MAIANTTFETAKGLFVENVTPSAKILET